MKLTIYFLAAMLALSCAGEDAPKQLIGIKDIKFTDWDAAEAPPGVENRDVEDCRHSKEGTDDILDWETWRLHCFYLHDTGVKYEMDLKEKRLIKEGTEGKIGFCKLHAIMLWKPNKIGVNKSDLNIDIKENMAEEKLQKDIFINPGIFQTYFHFYCSTLTWNKQAKKLTFESCGDVNVNSAWVIWQIQETRRNGKVIFKADPAGVTFKFEATIVNTKKSNVFGSKEQAVVDEASSKCHMQIKEENLEMEQIRESDGKWFTPKVLQAMGGMEEIKKRLIESACKRFAAGINFAIAHQLKDKKWNLMEQPDYEPMFSDGYFLKYAAKKPRDT